MTNRRRGAAGRTVSLLGGPAQLDERRHAAGGVLAPLADSLADELDRLLPSGDLFVPGEKAKLTRAGGRCPRDGAWLDFDPREPRRHRCPVCGSVYDDEAHYRWWIMGYQLWLAERAAIAASLSVLRGVPRHRSLAEQILATLAGAYLDYPNVDNVLGPTRPFFSTYLESIWLLQLAVALDLLELDSGAGSLGALVRERLLEPSAQLIASYNEGLSNRQVWNSAALAAAGRLLGNERLVEVALEGEGGLAAHLRYGVLPDGTWYEGENYHLFAHRGLWYLVTIAANAGATLPPALTSRFDDGFVTPFLTALPDFTFPSRRDSPYAVSLRQWRIAESAELGTARRPDDPRLSGALGELYRDDVPAGDTARWRSTAEAERNVAGTRLTRSDLGWKSLWAARPEIDIAAPSAPGAALLDGQGIGVVRRARGRLFVALDYGHSGGGHGHPDRLNLWLVDGAARVLEDVGTGSYVDRTLHWYRSTLAHNAPLIDGRSQDRVDGTLHAWEERGDLGWIDASAPIAPGVIVRRSIVTASSYLVDRLEWSAEREVTLDLPIHAGGELAGVDTWRPAALVGAGGLEDGFDFVTSAESAGAHARAIVEAAGAQAWVFVTEPHVWWRGDAPGPPGKARRRFLLVRATATRGVIETVWSWEGAVSDATRADGALRVRLRDGAVEIHRRDGDSWLVTRSAGSTPDTIVLRGTRASIPTAPAQSTPTARREPYIIPRIPSVPAAVGDLTGRQAPVPLQIRLSRAQYRRSEEDWRDAGAPEALVSLGATDEEVFIEVSVRKAGLVFAPSRPDNPLDNEHPDVNSDGIQLHASVPDSASRRNYSWLIVPDAGGPTVRITPRAGEPAIDVSGAWRPTRQGYQVLLRIPRAGLATDRAQPIWLDVVVNEMSADRERRRGQLALSAGPGEWVYLRGDRSDPGRFAAFRVAHG